MITERRQSRRYPANFFIHLAIDDQLHTCRLTDLSRVGLYARRPIQPLRRNSRRVQAELPLPGTSDSLWAEAELVYDRFDALFHGSAFRFTAMAQNHQDILRQWLRANQNGDLADRRTQQHACPGEVIVLRPGSERRKAA